MPYMDQEELDKWSPGPRCDDCGRFVGVGGYFELSFGIDGKGPTTVDEMLCKKHAPKQKETK